MKEILHIVKTSKNERATAAGAHPCPPCGEPAGQTNAIIGLFLCLETKKKQESRKNLCKVRETELCPDKNQMGNMG